MLTATFIKLVFFSSKSNWIREIKRQKSKELEKAQQLFDQVNTIREEN